MADDGEKFGVWPETYHSVYEEGWLERFFTLLEQTASGSRPRPFRLYPDGAGPRAIYLPTPRIMEMGRMDASDGGHGEYDHALALLKAMPEGGKIRPFIKGGTCGTFGQVPREQPTCRADADVSRKVHRPWSRRGSSASLTGKRRSCRPLYQSQCNDAYWHGVFAVSISRTSARRCTNTLIRRNTWRTSR